jgi:hypothetical protein
MAEQLLPNDNLLLSDLAASEQYRPMLQDIVAVSDFQNIQRRTPIMSDLRRGWQFRRHAEYRDDSNATAAVQGDPVWASTDPAIIKLVATDDPFEIIVQAVGAVGMEAEVSATADADLGAGVEPVVIRGMVHVISGQATSGSFDDSEPEPIPAP